MKRHLGALGIVLSFVAAQGCSDPPTPAASSSEIGRQRERIVGGVVEPNHRYVVSLNGCSGTVISKYTVLTAGHCYGSVSSVRFGPTSSGGTTIQIASKVRDPLYMAICDQDATYDLTVVKLASASPIQPAPLLRQTLDNTPKYIGPSWVWVGYGLTMQGGTSGTKRATTFPVDLVGPATGRGSLCDIPDTLIYATAHGRNACNGDSGGPSFWVQGGVEYLAGVVSSGDDACTLDDTQQRSDQPHIDRFIQAQIDANEGTDPCRSNGVCDETCNANGQLGDPDCAANHCTADGICAEACVAPRDPDCLPLDSSNCGDNGVCDMACVPTDPDCVRYCGAEGNCIPNCPTPDPDCAAQDGGAPPTSDAGTTDAGGGGSTDSSVRDAGVPDTAVPPTSDATSLDVTTPTADAATRDAAGSDVATRDSGGRDAVNLDATSSDGTTTDVTTLDATSPGDTGTTSDGGGAGGAGTGTGAGGSSAGTGGGATTEESGCSCHVGARRSTAGVRASWLALGLGLVAGALRRVRRRSHGR
jgi:hypothetical protein